MASDKTNRLNAFAAERGYSSYYQYRKAQAQAIGYSGYAEQRQARARAARTGDTRGLKAGDRVGGARAGRKMGRSVRTKAGDRLTQGPAVTVVRDIMAAPTGARIDFPLPNGGTLFGKGGIQAGTLRAMIAGHPAGLSGVIADQAAAQQYIGHGTEDGPDLDWIDMLSDSLSISINTS